VEQAVEQAILPEAAVREVIDLFLEKVFQFYKELQLPSLLAVEALKGAEVVPVKEIPVLIQFFQLLLLLVVEVEVQALGIPNRLQRV
jgi:hypothetical protein|tara:strand:+ start:333 stop:593 length:261 start_codon:yes stop_codon:yes gene_type:complete